LPLHPANFYCHTRLIYMGMSAIFGRKAQMAPNALIHALRRELYPAGFEYVDFRRGRNCLRRSDLFAPPGSALKLLYRVAGWYERFHARGLRKQVLGRMTESIRYELRTTDHTSISPVSGLLNLIALWLADPRDPDLIRGLQQFDGWIWEDDKDGLRVAGARSASWDSAFALQVLVAATPHVPVRTAMNSGLGFLASQQITESFPRYDEHARIDPKGGWCFAGVWHGWPVSDCTAEALIALLQATPAGRNLDQLAEGVRFILRTQNRDGGFGSYEPQRSRFNLERLNPAEMFADSMTEASFVECTSSCLVALNHYRERIASVSNPDIERAITGARSWLLRCQREDGSWTGSWGVNLIYGTMFGISGLLAAGVPPHHPTIRKACAWLKQRQRDDGGWGEHHSGCVTQSYVAHEESQIIQTAWALRALLEASDPDWGAITRGARFLVDRQHSDGTWPAQDMAGVFFRTALLDYTLYRSYFPTWALALYEARRHERLTLTRPRAAPVRAVAAMA
jgi:lanosterol synthase